MTTETKRPRDAKKKPKPLPPWCCASGCQGCTEFQEHSRASGLPHAASARRDGASYPLDDQTPQIEGETP